MYTLNPKLKPCSPRGIEGVLLLGFQIDLNGLEKVLVIAGSGRLLDLVQGSSVLGFWFGISASGL